MTVGGVEWSVPPHDAEDGFANRMAAGEWLPYHEIARVRDHARGRVMLDIGANIGTTSVTRAALGDFEAIYCAEPEPNNYAALCRTVKVNGLEGIVLPDRIALSDQNGEATFQVRLDGIARHHLAFEPAAGNIPVRVAALDSWVAELGVEPDDIAFIKTDCQGFDGRVLYGALGLLQRRRTVWQIEYWPWAMEKAGTPADEFALFLARHFTHFADVGRSTDEPVSPITEVMDRTAYLGERGFTELLLLNP